MSVRKRWRKARKASEYDWPQAHGKVAWYVAAYRFMGGKR